MKIKRKTAMVVETHQLTTVHLDRQPALAWCGPCRAQVLMITPQEAATLAHTTTREIFQRVESGALHFAEDATGRVLVCLNSLRQCSQTRASPIPAKPSDS